MAAGETVHFFLPFLYYAEHNSSPKKHFWLKPSTFGYQSQPLMLAYMYTRIEMPGHTHSTSWAVPRPWVRPQMTLGEDRGNPSHFLLTSQPLGSLTTCPVPSLGSSKSSQTIPMSEQWGYRASGPSQKGRSQDQRGLQGQESQERAGRSGWRLRGSVLWTTQGRQKPFGLGGGPGLRHHEA